MIFNFGKKGISMKPEDILKTLEELTGEEFEKFKWHLTNKGIPVCQLENANRHCTVNLIVGKYTGQEAQKVTKTLLKEIQRNDLIQRFLDCNPGSEVPDAQSISYYQRKLQTHFQDTFMFLISQSSILRELDLSNNNLQDDGVKLLSAGLESPHCRLKTLGLSGCLITEEGCASLASALISNPSHLRELDLSYNHPGDSGVKLLSAGREDSQWKLDNLMMDYDGEKWLKPGLRKYFCELAVDTNTVNNELRLSDDNRMVTRVEDELPYPDHLDRFDVCPQLLCRNGLSGRCYWEVEWSRGVEISSPTE
ncbi:hypothetical protein Q5P01_025844 [Channa striata]|uniref:Pyrin domain-containing protein n=1 Tax=Channa striata TaxID=64152 RepID=A0AA88IXK1_CHASR|nr:hypothetical protein Q5P01_025844 [Channa striata]